jgi:hypothetical protein
MTALTPAEPGNTRGVTHGTRSEKKLDPARRQFAEEVRRRYPDLDDFRLALLADRLAKIQLGNNWLDRQANGPIRTRKGDVFAIVKQIDGWSASVEKTIRDLEREKGGGGKSLAELMSAAIEEAGDA